MSTAIFSAQVVLNATQHPNVAEVATLLREAGFAVGPLGAGGIPISAPLETFEKFFHVQAQPTAASPFPGNELPLAALAEPLRSRIAHVVFSTLSFGPGGDF